jgi:hypothetical protein
MPERAAAQVSPMKKRGRSPNGSMNGISNDEQKPPAYEYITLFSPNLQQPNG